MTVFLIFQQFTYVFSIQLDIVGLFFSLFQCGPRDLFYSLMRTPQSQFEFDTPGLTGVN